MSRKDSVPPINMSKQCSVRWAFNFAKWSPNVSDLLSATSCVQPEEKVRLQRFVFKNDFKASLIGRLMMRKFVSEVTQTPYDQIRFIRDDKGKPELLLDGRNYPKVSYNVSHQGDYTVLAGDLGEGLVLGVDVMKVEYNRHKNLGEYFRIMSKTFSQSEWETIKSSGNDSNQLAMFCRHWCLKESYLKAVGVGITVDLREVCFKINTNQLRKDAIVTDTEVYFKGRKLDWEFQEMLLDDDHCVAVALNSKNNEKIHFKEISFQDLMVNSIGLLDKDEDYCKAYFKKEEKL